MSQFWILTGLLGGILLQGCQAGNYQNQGLGTSGNFINKKEYIKMDTATFGTGCFWCTEAIFQELKGVEKVTSGYSGGHVANPTYEQVSDKNTGHAEVIQMMYNPEIISFEELLEVFWKVHDPTTPNQQGNDIGPQYRSAIFYANDTQKELAEKYKQALNDSGAFEKPIVTEISPLINFFAAEAYHQNFYSNNPNYGYCAYVVRPKLDKFKKVFQDKLRKNAPAQ